MELGVFTAAELCAGGVNQRGFLQPLLPAPEGVADGLADGAALERLADRGLLWRGPSGWRAVGRYRQVLEAAASARSLLAVGPGEPGAPGFRTPRLVLGCLAATCEALDLWPGAHGYRARLLAVPEAAAELAEYVGALAAGVAGGGAAGGMAGVGAEVGAAGVGPEVGAAGGLAGGVGPGVIDRGTAGPAVRVEAASISRPEGPLFQQRLTVVATGARTRLLLGTRHGSQAACATALAGGVQLVRVLGDLLAGRVATL